LVNAEENGKSFSPNALTDYEKAILEAKEFDEPGERKTWESKTGIADEFQIKKDSKQNLHEPMDVASEKANLDVDKRVKQKEAELAATSATTSFLERLEKLEKRVLRSRRSKRVEDSSSSSSSLLQENEEENEGTCLVPLGTNQERIEPCHCTSVLDMANKKGVVMPQDIRGACRKDVERFAFREACSEMYMSIPQSCRENSNSLFRFKSGNSLTQTVTHSCEGLRLTLKTACAQHARVRVDTSSEHGKMLSRFFSKSVSLSIPSHVFAERWDTHQARFKQMKTEQPEPTGSERYLRPSLSSDSTAWESEESSTSKGAYSNIGSSGADILNAMQSQPVTLRWADPRYICKDGKPPEPRRSMTVSPIGKTGGVWVVHSGVGLNGGLGQGEPDDQISLFNSVNFASTSIPAKHYDFNDTYILIERFKDPTAECWAPQPFYNDSEAAVPDDTSYPNRTRPAPFGADDGCGEDNPKGLEDGNDDCCSPSNPCSQNHGNCKADEDCAGKLVCGWHNCPWKYRVNASVPADNCCWSPYLPGEGEVLHGAYTMDEKKIDGG